MAMPVSRTFSGASPFLRLNSINSPKDASAEITPTSQNQPLPEVMPNSMTLAIAPNAVPELMPKSSGPAIGFCVSLCSITPVSASMVPVAAASSTRG